MEYDFWITVLIGAIGGGIFGPMIARWLGKKGWIKSQAKNKDKESNS